MKPPPQVNENKALPSTDIMSQMQVLLSEKDDIIDKKSDVIAQQQHRIEILEEYLRLANSKRFGPSSEQMPEQGNLFNEAETSSEPEQEELELPQTDGENAKTGRKPFAKNIPRHQVFAYLSVKSLILFRQKYKYWNTCKKKRYSKTSKVTPTSNLPRWLNTSCQNPWAVSI